MGSPFRFERRVPTQSISDVSIISIILGNNSGGSCKSTSMTVTKSPLEACKPAYNAASLPKLREKEI